MPKIGGPENKFLYTRSWEIRTDFNVYSIRDLKMCFSQCCWFHHCFVGLAYIHLRMLLGCPVDHSWILIKMQLIFFFLFFFYVVHFCESCGPYFHYNNNNNIIIMSLVLLGSVSNDYYTHHIKCRQVHTGIKQW